MNIYNLLVLVQTQLHHRTCGGIARQRIQQVHQGVGAAGETLIKLLAKLLQLGRHLAPSFGTQLYAIPLIL